MATRDRSLAMFCLALMLLLSTPAFFLMGGNAVRQGLAGSLGLAAVALVCAEGRLRYLLLVIPVLFIHQYGVVVFVAIVAAIYLPRWLLPLWLASHLVSPVMRLLASSFGYNLDALFSYTSYSEGIFHLEKLALHSILVVGVLWSLYQFPPSENQRRLPDLRVVYIYLVSISNLVLVYEVPYERLLLFADLTAVLALVAVATPWMESRWFRRFAAMALLLAPLLLWNATSIQRTLGYA